MRTDQRPAPPAPAPAGSADQRERCDAITAPAEGPVAISGTMLLAEKCTQPAEFATAFWCPNGHYAENVKCEPHCRPGVTQLCGYCADAGHRVPATVRVLCRL
jgi:hypothetical protein